MQERTSALQIGMAHAVWCLKLNFVSGARGGAHGARGTYAMLHNNVRGARAVLKCFYMEYKIYALKFKNFLNKYHIFY